jgi:type 2 lantibiotic biosynthesis protein LanM
LLRQLSRLSAPALYERFAEMRKTERAAAAATMPSCNLTTACYERFVADMQAGGFQRLFNDKPVLLRLIASITRQWIETSRELMLRLAADLPSIRADILLSGSESRVSSIEADLSDPHNGGRSVQIVTFADGARVVYKPKDLRLDVRWHSLIERLNGDDTPFDLKAVRAIGRDGYGWTEFTAHTGCTDRQGVSRFFRRAGGWLALFHCFAANDMHQENIVAAGDHPVPIDLETILQAAEPSQAQDPEDEAFEAALETLANSVMMVGLLPAYTRSPENEVIAIGGMTADWASKTQLDWVNVNSDDMRPVRTQQARGRNPNLPHVAGSYAKLGDHVDDFVSGFEDYARFLLCRSRDANQGGLFEGFSDLPVRRVVRPTRFYDMLLQRLKNHRTMHDGVVWSAQADFLARLADWEKDSDPLWPSQRAERAALLALDVPHFVTPSDRSELRDAAGALIRTDAQSGLSRARARVQRFNEQDIAWQIEVIRQNTSSLPGTVGASISARPAGLLTEEEPAPPAREAFVAEADRIAGELSHWAIHRGPGAAWIGIDWLGDAEVFQLACLGGDLYNGVSGLALFLAAHAKVTGCGASRELALAGLLHLRKSLRGRHAARMARSLGIGGAVGLGSIVYALAVISDLLHDGELLADARVAADLFTDDLIAADKQLDAIGGSAGAILGLLRLHRDTGSDNVLSRAIRCGEHLLAQSRVGPEGRRSWVGQGAGTRALNGMSHGAAGFAYALASLAAATGRDEFARAAAESIAFEDASYVAARSNWPDLRGEGEPAWPCQWCHGAPGIGLARLAMMKRGRMNAAALTNDVRSAIQGVERAWPGAVDTLCCGTLGSVEFMCEAAGVLDRGDLRELASRRLMAVLRSAAASGDYRWNSGQRRFNLGLFRGIAGVGYTSLRQVDPSLPNVLIWD